MGYGLEAALAGIGGATKGMAEGFSWQKNRDDEQARLDHQEEMERRRQDVMQHLARIREEGDAARANQTAGDKLVDQMPDSDAKRRALAARAKRVGLDLDQEAFREPSTEPLPSRALPSLGSTEASPGVAGRTPVTFGPSPGVAPKYSIDPQVQAIQSKAVEAERATEARRRGVLEDYEKRKQIDRRYDKPGITPVGPKDDPSLPRGVKAYLGTLRQKYGTLDGAVGEFTDALDDLYDAHPNLDAAKARRTLDTLYKSTAPPPTRPGIQDFLTGGNGPVPVTPVGAGSGVQVPDREREEPPPAAAAPPPVGARTPVTPRASSPPPSPKPADANVDLEVRKRAKYESLKREIGERQRKGQDYQDLVKEMTKLLAKPSGGGR